MILVATNSVLAHVAATKVGYDAGRLLCFSGGRLVAIFQSAEWSWAYAPHPCEIIASIQMNESRLKAV